MAVTVDVKGHLVGKHVVDLVQEISGHRLDASQRMSKILFALPLKKKKKTQLNTDFFGGKLNKCSYDQIERQQYLV